MKGSHYPIEAWLRPPVELYSAVTAASSATLAWVSPELLLTTPTVAHGAAVGLLGLALVRTRQGLTILRFQRNLKRLPVYLVPIENIPVSHERLFLGRGFRWQVIHTQRLADTRQPEVQKYLQPASFYQWVRRFELYAEQVQRFQRLARWTASPSRFNPLAPLPPVGGDPVLHGLEPDERDVSMALVERVGHTLVLGTTRVGKTRLAEVLITQDIHRGEVVIVLDPKSDKDLLRRIWTEAKRAGRANQFYFFHLGFPEVSARYNALGDFARITELATRIANQLPSSGNSAAFREFAWRFTNLIARALVALGRRPDYHQMARHILNMDTLFLEYCRQWLNRNAPGWQQAVSERAARIQDRDLPPAMRGRSKEVLALSEFIRNQNLYDTIADGLISAVQYDKTYFDKIVASVLPMLEKLTTGKTAELIAPDYFDLNDRRPVFDWLSVIRKRAIVYVGLDALSDATVAAAVGNSMFADLTSVAGRLYKFGHTQGLPDAQTPEPAPRVALHADEFNELIRDEFIPLLNKAGGAGFQATCYTQTWSDVEARLQDKAKAGQVAGNFNTLVCLRVQNDETARMLTDKLPEVEIRALKTRSGATDSSTPENAVDFTSTTLDDVATQRVPMLTPADLIQLPKGQCFALIEGGQLYKLRLPLLDTEHDPFWPASVEAALSEIEAIRLGRPA